MLACLTEDAVVKNEHLARMWICTCLDQEYLTADAESEWQNEGVQQIKWWETWGA